MFKWIKNRINNKIKEREKALKAEQDAVLERHRILAEADKANKEAKRLLNAESEKEREKERQKKRIQRETNTVRTQQRTNNSMPYYSNHDNTITPTSIVMHDTFMHDRTSSRSYDDSCSSSHSSSSYGSGSSSYDSSSSSSSYDSGSSSSYSSCD